MILYLTEPGYHLSYRNGQLQVNRNDQIIKTLPIKLVSHIVTYPFCRISSGSTAELLRENIPVFYLSSRGEYLGKLIAVKDVNVDLQRKQILLGEDAEQCLAMTKNIIRGKVQNQITYLRRLYRDDEYALVKKAIDALNQTMHKIPQATSVDQLMGYEGAASSIYFRALSEYLPADFKVTKRTKNPPLDPINSLLSLTYTLLHSEVFNALEFAGLNPYFSFVHKVRKGHAALASDMMEELRGVIADPLVVHFVNFSGITPGDFKQRDDSRGYFVDRQFVKKLFSAYEKKLQQKHQYLDKPMSYRNSVAAQANHLATCVSGWDLGQYKPLRLR